MTIEQLTRISISRYHETNIRRGIHQLAEGSRQNVYTLPINERTDIEKRRFIRLQTTCVKRLEALKCAEVGHPEDRAIFPEHLTEVCDALLPHAEEATRPASDREKGHVSPRPPEQGIAPRSHGLAPVDPRQRRESLTPHPQLYQRNRSATRTELGGQRET